MKCCLDLEFDFPFRYRYKQEYEKFKLTVTYVIMCLALFLTFFGGYRSVLWSYLVFFYMMKGMFWTSGHSHSVFILFYAFIVFLLTTMNLINLKGWIVLRSISSWMDETLSDVKGTWATLRKCMKWRNSVHFMHTNTIKKM